MSSGVPVRVSLELLQRIRRSHAGSGVAAPESAGIAAAAEAGAVTPGLAEPIAPGRALCMAKPSSRRRRLARRPGFSGASAEVGPRKCRWDVGDVDGSDVGSRRHDLVDAVEQVVVEER
ncbi:hypothetical protein, partial [Embleya sp. NPDC059237]|uniref:hypothetical protein n=1 Tax=Embleya sp. NPDC059237 TaxID=3346784 RepID=UPI0036A1D8AE